MQNFTQQALMRNRMAGALMRKSGTAGAQSSAAPAYSPGHFSDSGSMTEEDQRYQTETRNGTHDHGADTTTTPNFTYDRSPFDHHNGNWPGTHEAISDYDAQAGHVPPQSDKGARGAGNVGWRGWANDHPLGVIAAMAALTAGGAYLAGGAGAGAGAGGGGSAGGATASGGGGIASAGGGGGGFSYGKALMSLAGSNASNPQQAQQYDPPPEYRPVQFRDTFSESQRRKRQAGALQRVG